MFLRFFWICTKNVCWGVITTEEFDTIVRMKCGLCGEISTSMFLIMEEGRMGFAQNAQKYNYTGFHKPKDNIIIFVPQRIRNIFFCHHYMLRNFISYIVLIFKIPKHNQKRRPNSSP